MQEIMIQNRAVLVSFAETILRNREDAKDVVQEVFEQTLMQPSERVSRPYLFQAVRNRALNQIRSRNRLSHFLDHFSAMLDTTLNVIDSPNEESFSILDAVNHLSKQEKEVLHLRIKGELKISEIAQVLDIPEGTVKSRLNKSLNSLRKLAKRGIK